jgi:pimeloyl-ACP methyl ester carboxylesterase
MTDQPEPKILLAPDGEKIAYCHDENMTGSAKRSVGAVWLGGFKSDMTGTKATTLAEWAEKTSRNYTRFDYFGHGQSSGQFVEGTISRWRADALAILDKIATGPQVLIGSSMGAWIALLAALARPDQVKGLVLIAPAPDFTEKLMWAGFDDNIRAQLQNEGVYRQPSDYDEPYEISYELIKDGRNHLLLDNCLELDLPIRILQGMNDPDVPWEHAMLLAEKLTSSDLTVSLNKKGDHRLSEPDDLRRLTNTLDEISARVEG